MSSSLAWKRNRRWVVGSLVGGGALVALLREVRITAVTTSERNAADPLAFDAPGVGDLFDDETVHDLALDLPAADYAALIEAYREHEEKIYATASVTIDGTRLSPVGARLKGNSTLMGLREGGFFGGSRGPQLPSGCDPEMFAGPAGPGGPPGAPVPGGLPAGMPVPGEGALPGGLPAGLTAPAEGTPPAGAPPVGQPGADGATPTAGGFGGLMGSVSADDPSSLPWLVRFDEFTDGQRYQGLRDIAIRPVVGNQTSLNEALALRLVAMAGEPTERAAYAAVTVNGSDPVLRLLLEPPGEAYAEANDLGDGVLYKALSTGSFTYRGDDPSAYVDQFDQETRRNRQDLKPLIDLLRWVAESSDEEFAAEIGDRLDAESFARYVALQSLLDNFDDMAGPGQNYYLWYDLDEQRFRVLAWDLNLALSGFGDMMGSGGPPSWIPSACIPEEFREGATGSDPAATPGATPAAAADGAGDPSAAGETPRRRRGGPGDRQFGGNLLKERFLATPALRAQAEAAFVALQADLFASGAAAAELDRLSAVVASSGLLDPATVDAETAALHAKLAAQATAEPAFDKSPFGGG